MKDMLKQLNLLGQLRVGSYHDIDCIHWNNRIMLIIVDNLYEFDDYSHSEYYDHSYRYDGDDDHYSSDCDDGICI